MFSQEHLPDHNPFLFNLGAPTNSDARPCLGMGAFRQKCLLCYVPHYWTLGMHVGEYGQTLRKLFVQTGGCTTVEVLNPASSFSVACPLYPPHLVLGRKLHNVGGEGGEVYQSRCRI